MTVELCEVMRKAGQDFFTGKKCQAKSADMKAVLESMQSIKSELGNIRNAQADQEAERGQVLEGLKAVAKRHNRIEKVQEEQDQCLTKHDEAIDNNTRRREEGEEKIKKLKERMKKIDQNAIGMRQCKVVAREVREMEKRERRIVIFNVPESTEREEEDKIKADVKRVDEVLKELNFEGSRPKYLGRIGKTGKYPSQILGSLQNVEECEGVVKKSRDGPKLTGDVFVNHDRTFNQRQKAKLFPMEREEEEKGGDASQAGRGGGKARGRSWDREGAGRGVSGRGGRGESRRGGRGGGGDRGTDSESISNDDDDDDEAKRQRVRAGSANAPSSDSTTDQTRATKPVSEHPARPHSTSNPVLGAMGGINESF